MRRVFSSFDLLAVRHAANLLELEGIRSMVRNEILSSAAGELPPAECEIELWVLDDTQAGLGEALLRRAAAARAPDGPPWNCGRCGEEHEVQFLQCWNCGLPRAT